MLAVFTRIARGWWRWIFHFIHCGFGGFHKLQESRFPPRRRVFNSACYKAFQEAADLTAERRFSHNLNKSASKKKKKERESLKVSEDPHLSTCFLFLFSSVVNSSLRAEAIYFQVWLFLWTSYLRNTCAVYWPYNNCFFVLSEALFIQSFLKKLFSLRRTNWNFRN